MASIISGSASQTVAKRKQEQRPPARPAIEKQFAGSREPRLVAYLATDLVVVSVVSPVIVVIVVAVISVVVLVLIALIVVVFSRIAAVVLGSLAKLSRAAQLFLWSLSLYAIPRFTLCHQLLIHAFRLIFPAFTTMALQRGLCTTCMK